MALDAPNHFTIRACRRQNARVLRGSTCHPMYRRSRVRNVFSVDVEDWAHGLLGGATPITSRVVGNVERMLELLRQFQIRATFFALGKVCKAFPDVLPTIASEGHEIASHGFGHERVDKLRPQAFREDLHRSIDIIGEQVGAAPIGYRAPQFSITRQTSWAGEIIAEMGFKYSSSVFPFEGARYGIGDAPRYVYCWPDCDLIEFPLTILECGRRRIPVAGGGYLRLLPVYFLEAAVRQANHHGQPAVVYMHPYELDVSEVRDACQSGLPVSRWTAFKQALCRRAIPRRLSYLFRHFRFAPMREVLNLACAAGPRA